MSEFEPIAILGADCLGNSQLAAPDDVSYYVLEKERKLFIDFEIDMNLMSIIRMIFRWNAEDKGKPVEERVPIKLYIMSPGGDVNCMWSLIDVITASATPVWTVNINMCYSAASEIFVAGHKRFMFKHAKVMYHDGYTRVETNTNRMKSQMEAIYNEIEQSNYFMLSHTNIPAVDLDKHRDDDWVMNADYCLEHGVCHKVIDSLDEVI